MIPLRDDQPTRTFPVVTVLIIALNVIVYIAQVATHGLLDASWSLVPYEVIHNVDLQHAVGHMNSDGLHVYTYPPNVPIPFNRLGPNDIYYGPSPHPLWLTIFTSMFMHSGLLHIGGNMLYLWIFGNNIEDVLGRVKFLVFYLVCGVLAAAAQIVTEFNPFIPNVGASGAIAGVLGAYLMLFPEARVLSIVPIFGFGFLAEVRAVWVLGLWIALQVGQGLLGIGMQRGGGVAYFAHIGGFLSGVLLILLLGGRRLVRT